MPNKHYNPKHPAPADGQSTNVTNPSKTYGNSPSFPVMTDADNTLTNPDKPKAKSKW